MLIRPVCLSPLHIRYASKKTLHTVAVSRRLCGTAAIKLCSNFAQTMLKLRSNSSKRSTCDKTLLSQPFYSTCWLCTCGPYIQVLIVLSTLVIIAKMPLWALPAFYALVKGWSKYGQRMVRPEFFSHCENTTVCRVFFDTYGTCNSNYNVAIFSQKEGAFITIIILNSNSFTLNRHSRL